MTLHGIIPPMTTPFGADGELKLDLVRGQVDWLVGQGVHGVAAGGSTGEGHTLDAAECRGFFEQSQVGLEELPFRDAGRQAGKGFDDEV